MSTIILLAMHGAPPNDFPQQEMGEFFGLHMQLEQIPARAIQADPRLNEKQKRHDELHTRLRAWPRTPQNDPFYQASLSLADALSQAIGCPVKVGFNEFCGPNLEQALDATVAEGATRVVVLTPMMTRGGEHSEKDIPEAVEQARSRHPQVEFAYAWPFDTQRVAQFLAEQARQYL